MTKIVKNDNLKSGQDHPGPTTWPLSKAYFAPFLPDLIKMSHFDHFWPLFGAKNVPKFLKDPPFLKNGFFFSHFSYLVAIFQFPENPGIQKNRY